MTDSPPSQGAQRRALLLAFCALAASCATPYPASGPVTRALGPKLDLGSISAPFQRHGSQELALLGQDPGYPPANLRRAHIYIETGRPQRAVALLSAMLYGPPRPSPAVESHALYQRARARDRLGETKRAIIDCRRAAALAMDPGLRRATEAMLRRHGALAIADPEPQRAPRVQIHSRSGWGADRPRTRDMNAMGKIYRITVHHSANLARSPSLREATRTIKLDQRYHMATNGWGDIGYHYLIDPAGRVWQGRNLRWQGAHAGNHTLNRGNIGVCLLGNFIGGRRGQSPSAAQIAALDSLLRQLAHTHRIRQSKIFTHQELEGVVTLCPGFRLQRVVDRLRRHMVAAVPAPYRAVGGSNE